MAGTVKVNDLHQGVVLVEWTALSGTENGQAAELTRYPDKSVQTVGTFTSITIQGSMDGTNWATLHDVSGADLVFTSAGLRQILENPRYIRPSGNTVTGGATVRITGVSNW